MMSDSMTKAKTPDHRQENLSCIDDGLGLTSRGAIAVRATVKCPPWSRRGGG